VNIILHTKSASGSSALRADCLKASATIQATRLSGGRYDPDLYLHIDDPVELRNLGNMFLEAAAIEFAARLGTVAEAAE
jgi:hypothetical protein